MIEVFSLVRRDFFLFAVISGFGGFTVRDWVEMNNLALWVRKWIVSIFEDEGIHNENSFIHLFVLPSFPLLFTS